VLAKHHNLALTTSLIVFSKGMFPEVRDRAGTT
jgi:hypothetical protein